MGKKPKNKKKQKADNAVAQPQQSSNSLPTLFLSAISLICGCLVMVIELTSSRVLAPYYGNTIYCWTGVIGTVLFAMSLGYLIGGFLAEKQPREKLLYVLLIVSGLTASTIPFTARWLAGFLTNYNSYTTGPIIGSLLIFCLPAFCLSTIPPLCVKIISENVKMVGVASGIVSSTSAIGSILGTFLTGFYLIPNFALSQIYFFTAVIPFILCLVAYSLAKVSLNQKAIKVAVLLVVSFTLWEVQADVDVFPVTDNKKEVYKNLNQYHLVRVYDQKNAFLLKLDSTQEGALTKKNGELIFRYTKYWELIKCFRKKSQLQSACFIGGGAFAMPTIFHKNFPDCRIDAVEIDPELKEIGKRFFQLKESDNLQVHIDDGRRWFRGKQEAYNFIFLDAFHGVRSIPHHLVTSEYFQELNTALTENGVIAINVIAAREGKQSQLYKSLLKTIKQHFESIVVFAVNTDIKKARTNLILFAFKKAPNMIQARRRADKLYLGSMFYQKVAVVDDAFIARFADHPILTDEYAPVEYMVAE
ncbi:fused MFS/spermidine synthase [Candidatus Uabimicrobium sp. HlEnr_7]|uniref:fused MFS/spermidine synthase n=1 Tax=Candidatus Uabimicrobium helgolandensis TaxID=3095367 RepID=UPI0035574540